MSLATAEIHVPSGNGAGASVNTVELGVWKTFILIGDLVGQIAVEGSNDGVTWVPLYTFPGSVATHGLRAVTRFLRATVTGYIGGSATLTVSAQEKVTSFETLVVPDGDGVSEAVNVNAAGDIWTVMGGGSFDGAVHLEISQDNLVWSPAGITFTGIGQVTRILSATYARVRRTGFNPYRAGTATMSLGITPNTAPSVGGGGGEEEGEPLDLYDFPLNNIEDFGAISSGDPVLNRDAVVAAIVDAKANNIAGIFVPAGVFGCSWQQDIDGTVLDGSFLFQGTQDFLIMGLGPRSILRMEDDPGQDWKFFALQSLRDTVVVPAGNATGTVKALSAHESPRRLLTVDVSVSWVGTATVQTSPDGTTNWTTRGVFTADGSVWYNSSDGFARVVTTARSAGTAQIRIQTPCKRVWFHGVVMDGSGVVNATEQTHLLTIGNGDINIGGNAEETKITDCLFFDAFGDAIRMIGCLPLGGTQNALANDILIDGCYGFDNLRVFFSVQRAANNVVLSRTYAEGGTDQIVDFEPSGTGSSDMTVADCIFRSTISQTSVVALSGSSGDQRSVRLNFTRNLVLNGPMFVIGCEDLNIEDSIVTGFLNPLASRPGITLEERGSRYHLRGCIIMRSGLFGEDADIGALALSGTESSDFLAEECIFVQKGYAHIANVEGIDRAVIRGCALVYAGVATTFIGISSRATVRVMEYNHFDDNCFIGDAGGGSLVTYVQVAAAPYSIENLTVRDNVGRGGRDGVTFSTAAGTTAFFPNPPICRNAWDIGVGGAAFKSLNLLKKSRSPDVLQAVCTGGNVAPGAPRMLCQQGVPTAIYAAPPGSLYRNLTGGANTTLYVKESGTDASGWVAK